MTQYPRRAPESPPIAELAGLIRLWGAVRYFHPWLATDHVDWDSALVRAVTAMLGTGDMANGFPAAVRTLLGVLDDPATDLVDPSPATPDYDGPAVLDGPDGTVVLVLAGIPALGEAGVRHEYVAGLLADIARAPGLVVDLRGATSRTAFSLLPGIFGGLAGTGVPTPARRWRGHRGCPPQTTWTVDVYRTGTEQETPRMLTSWAAPLTVPTVVVMSEANDPGYLEALALREAGRVSVVHAGPVVTSLPGETLPLPGSLAVRMRSHDILATNGVHGTPIDVLTESGPLGNVAAPAMRAAFDLLGRRPADAVSPAAGVPRRPASSRPQAPAAVPDVAHRVLGLAKAWAAVEWFFPHQDLCDLPWSSALTDALPGFLHADDDGYAQAVAALAHRLDDGHAIVTHPAVLARQGGPVTVPALIRLLGQESIICQVHDPTCGLRIGDVVVEVDGEPVTDRRKRIGESVAASTPAGRDVMVDWLLLTGEPGSTCHLHVVRPDEGDITVVIPRRAPDPAEPRPGRPAFAVLPSGLGYLDLAKLTVEDVPAAFDAVRATPALLIDLRGYPKGTGESVASRLTGREVTYAVQRMCAPTAPARHGYHESPRVLRPARPAPDHAGPVFVIVDESTISFGEEAALMIDAATAGTATFVGSPTNGSIGEVTDVRLPGGVGFMFGGADIRHPNGERLQRRGIQPHVHLRPTADSLREGRDAVLDAAIEHALAQVSGSLPPADQLAAGAPITPRRM